MCEDFKFTQHFPLPFSLAPFFHTQHSVPHIFFCLNSSKHIWKSTISHHLLHYLLDQVVRPRSGYMNLRGILFRRENERLEEGSQTNMASIVHSK